MFVETNSNTLPALTITMTTSGQPKQEGIVDGLNGVFNPSESLTRAQLAKILVLAFDITPGGASTFKDLPTTHWSYAYIAALAEVGIELGDNGNFRPNEPVTRA